jgi:hypothetical protein
MKTYRVTFRVDAKDESATAETLKELVEFALLNVFVDSPEVGVEVVEETR